MNEEKFKTGTESLGFFFLYLFIAGGEPANFKISGSYVQAVCPRVRQS